MKLNELNSITPDSAAIYNAVQQFTTENPSECHPERNPVQWNPLDLALQSAVAKMTQGLSPIGLSLAFQDWLMHLAASPGKQGELLARAARQALASLGGAKTDVSAGADGRFADQGWANWPFNVFATAFLQTEDFWKEATSGIRGVSPHHAQVVNFLARQWLDMFAPSNFSFSNPEAVRAAFDSKGQNFVSGWTHWLDDLSQDKAKNRQEGGGQGNPTAYQVGKNVALTPGKVVYRNALVELIQYAPHSATVYREPVLIVSSWIMKYYILDLSPHNSLVRYLVSQGHTVFMVSWRNPGAADRNLGMADYLSLGLFDVLRELGRISANAPVHAVGYCLGGTLLAIAAATLGRGSDGAIAPLKSVTLLAAQADFSDPGELGLFIDDSQLAFLDSMMWDKGYLDGSQMAGSFQLLNSRDLVWSAAMRKYLLGIRTEPNDLMAWNADTTRMPYRMHSDYLKHLFLHNDLARGNYCVNGKPVALKNIDAPMYVVGTERDHVSPWRSVYKIHLLSNTEIDFVLASGGHNAGIVSEPGHARRSFQVLPHGAANGAYVGPDAWLAAADKVDGSWWPNWQQWLAAHSGPVKVAPCAMGAGASLENAPGQYVLGA